MHRNIRLSPDLHGRLVNQANRFAVSKAEVFRKALRKWTRKFGEGVVISENPSNTTSKGIVYRGGAPDHLLDGRSAAEIRIILDWYLAILESATDPKPITIDKSDAELIQRVGIEYKEQT